MSISKVLCGLMLTAVMTFGFVPSAVTPSALEAPPAEAGPGDFQGGCAVAFGSIFVPWARAGGWVAKWLGNRWVASGTTAATLFSCQKFPPSYPNGPCVSWNGPRGRCSHYANGCMRFGTPYQRSLCK
ncbi:MAG: hypothetical protein AAF467_13185 [Actinomycetota bacterium]